MNQKEGEYRLQLSDFTGFYHYYKYRVVNGIIEAREVGNAFNEQWEVIGNSLPEGAEIVNPGEGDE